MSCLVTEDSKEFVFGRQPHDFLTQITCYYESPVSHYRYSRFVIKYFEEAINPS